VARFLLLALFVSTFSSVYAFNFETKESAACSSYKLFLTDNNGVPNVQEREKSNTTNPNCIILRVPNIGDCYVKGYTNCTGGKVDVIVVTCGSFENPISKTSMEFEQCKSIHKGRD